MFGGCIRYRVRGAMDNAKNVAALCGMRAKKYHLMTCGKVPAHRARPPVVAYMSDSGSSPGGFVPHGSNMGHGPEKERPLLVMSKFCFLLMGYEAQSEKIGPARRMNKIRYRSACNIVPTFLWDNLMLAASW